MSNTFTDTKEVYGMERKDGKKGPWLAFKTKDDNGQERTTNVFGEMVGLFCGGSVNGKPVAGSYEITYEKNGKYWQVSKATLKTGSNGNGATASFTKSAGRADANVTRQNDSICAQVCVKASAEIISKAIEAGLFKDLGLGDIADHSAIICRVLMREVNTFLVGEEQPAPKAYVDSDGLTHEPVEA